MEKSLLDQDVELQSNFPTSGVMHALITDLRQLRTEDNAPTIDKLIRAAEHNYFDDCKSPRYATPLVELSVLCKRLGLTTLRENVMAGKYDVFE